MKPLNAGKYNKKIVIYQVVKGTNKNGFPIKEEKEILKVHANVKTTKGYTLIANNSDFEKAYTNFTIRFPKTVEITRDMLIRFRNKVYSIEYLNNVDENGVELEMQCKEVTK